MLDKNPKKAIENYDDLRAFENRCLLKIFGISFDFFNNPLNLSIAIFMLKVLKISLISVNNMHNRILLEFEMNFEFNLGDISLPIILKR